MKKAPDRDRLAQHRPEGAEEKAEKSSSRAASLQDGRNPAAPDAVDLAAARNPAREKRLADAGEGETAPGETAGRGRAGAFSGPDRAPDPAAKERAVRKKPKKAWPVQTRRYPSDIGDAQWELVKPLLGNMRLRKWPKRLLLNAVFYAVKTGCQWRMLPADFPPPFTVYSFFRRAALSGLWERILKKSVAFIRAARGLPPEPDKAWIDSQSVKTVYEAEDRGYDGYKKVKGHKRQLVVDSIGSPLAVHVHAANRADTKEGARAADIAMKNYPGIASFEGDRGYRGTFARHVSQKYGIPTRIRGEKGASKGRDRLISEHFFAWLNGYRRLFRDSEKSLRFQTAIIEVACIQILGKRIGALAAKTARPRKPGQNLAPMGGNDKN